MRSLYVVYTPGVDGVPPGYLTWNDQRGTTATTPRIEDAATFTARGARNVRAPFNGAALTTDGKLLTLSELARECEGETEVHRAEN